MRPTKFFKDSVTSDLLAANATLDANGTFEMELSKAEFDESDGTGFTECDFDAYASINADGCANGVDTQTGNRQFTLTPPAGGFRFVAGANLSAPQQIHGYRIKDGGGNVLAHLAYDEPYSVVNPGDQHNVTDANFQFSETAFS